MKEDKEDKLRQYVQKHPRSFDLYEDDYEELWKGISDRLDKKSRTGVWTIMRYAAAAVAIILVASLVIININTNKIDQQLSQNDLPVELAEAVFYYENMISDKLQVVQANSKEVDEQIFNDLKAYDAALIELKNDLKDKADNEEVIAAMIQNYKIKLELLEAILNEIESTNEENQNEKNSHEAVSI